MLTRWTIALWLTAMTFSTTSRAQDASPPSGDQGADNQQMQQTVQTIIRNMVAKGVDPRQIFQQIQEGVDPAEIQQELISKGVADQQTFDDLQSRMEKLTDSRLKDQLKASDAEWNVIQPRIQKVLELSAAVDRRAAGPMARFMPSRSAEAAAVAKAERELRAAIKTPDTTAQQFKDLLAALRDARAKAQVQLSAASSDLTSVLNVRQEGTLFSLGIFH